MPLAESTGSEMTGGQSVYFKKIVSKANFDDKFTLLYESDTLQLMHFTNGNIKHCVCY